MTQFNRSTTADTHKSAENRAFERLVDVKNVSKRFENGLEALKGLSLSLFNGERVSLLGASGCGKSTALRLISRLDEPTSGTVELNLESRHSLAFVFQDPTLLPWGTVFDNVAKPLSLAGLAKSKIKPRVDEMLHRVDLSDFAGGYPRELSGGMKMRVSIARALVTRPSLLLMDEPFAALDEITRFRLNDMLLEQQSAEGFSLLFVTHSVFESVYLSDRVLVMSPRPGKIVDTIDTTTKALRDGDYRLSSQYIKTCKAVSVALDHAMHG